MTKVRYDVEPGTPIPGLAELPEGMTAGEPRTYDLSARYFDTEDLRLAARGITLRLDGGWHLGLPSGSGREPAVAPADDPPVEIVAHLRGRPLVQVATLRTRRTVIPLLDADGEVADEIIDDEVTADGRAAAWREIEADPAGPLGDHLRDARPAPPVAGRLRPSRGSAPREYRTAGDVIASYVERQTATILDYDPRVRRAEYDAVHKMRVAVRRTRSILRTAGSLLDRRRASRLEAELRWLAGELGEVRDLEVLRERFAARLGELGEPAPSWLSGLGDRERGAYERLDRTLSGERYFALLDDLEAFAGEPPFTKRAAREAGTAVPELVAGAWRRVLRRHAEMEHAADPDEARHRTRKAAKRARYTAEAARPVLGEPARNLAAQASRVQEVLGAYQDSVIAREHLAGLDAGANEDPTIGRLIVVERAAADHALDAAHEVWREATDPKYVEALTGRSTPA